MMYVLTCVCVFSHRNTATRCASRKQSAILIRARLSKVKNTKYVIIILSLYSPFSLLISQFTRAGFVYPPLNKPFAIVDWLTSGGGRELSASHEVIICDVDFLFLKPLPLGSAKAGRPAASSRYYLGSWWLFNNDDIRQFCNGQCNNVTRSDVDQYYDVG